MLHINLSVKLTATIQCGDTIKQSCSLASLTSRSLTASVDFPYTHKDRVQRSNSEYLLQTQKKSSDQRECVIDYKGKQYVLGIGIGNGKWVCVRVCIIIMCIIYDYY